MAKERAVKGQCDERRWGGVQEDRLLKGDMREVCVKEGG